MKALLRRYCVYQGKGQPGATYEDNMLSAQGITIALDHNQVWGRGRERDLTEIEYQILRLLMQRPQWFLRPGHLREHLERALLPRFQRHGDGAHPQAAHQN